MALFHRFLFDYTQLSALLVLYYGFIENAGGLIINLRTTESSGFE
jgi:hypothetical protein